MAYAFRRCCDTPASSKHKHLKGCQIGEKLEADAEAAAVDNLHHIVAHFAVEGVDDLATPPTMVELADLVETLAEQSVSMFDIKAQAIVMITRLQIALQNARSEKAR